LLLLALAAVTGLAACTQRQRSPEELKEKTAEATATLKANARAIGQGIKEGWNRDHPLDLNRASRDQLTTLPGISEADAERIMAARPYNVPNDLVARQIVSQAEYDRISDKVTAK